MERESTAELVEPESELTAELVDTLRSATFVDGSGGLGQTRLGLREDDLRALRLLELRLRIIAGFFM